MHIRRVDISPYVMGDGFGKATLVIDKGYVYKYVNREWVKIRETGIEDLDFIPTVYDTANN